MQKRAKVIIIVVGLLAVLGIGLVFLLKYINSGGTNGPEKHRNVDCGVLQDVEKDVFTDGYCKKCPPGHKMFKMYAAGNKSVFKCIPDNADELCPYSENGAESVDSGYNWMGMFAKGEEGQEYSCSSDCKTAVKMHNKPIPITPAYNCPK